MLTDFDNYFTVRIMRKFVITLSLKIPSNLKRVATLPCEMSSVCRSVSLIAPLVSGVAGLSASYSSKADTLNIWRKNCRMWQLLLITTETINTLFPVVNFLKLLLQNSPCFQLLFLKTLDISQGSVVTHLRCGGIFSDRIITNFIMILIVK